MNQLLRFSIAFILFTSILSFPCFAQFNSANDYPLTFFTTEDGISQGTNRYMLQDSKGYMWLSSQDGINRYNGIEFFHFPDSFFYKNCEPIKQVFGIVEDLHGDIWMGSRRGLYKYQQTSNTFIKYDVSPGKQAMVNIVMPFAVMGTEVWFSENALSFKAIDCNTQKTRELFHVSDSVTLIESFKIIPQVDNEGNIWMANANKLFKIDVKKKTIKKFPVYFHGIDTNQNILFRSLSLDNSTNVLAVATGEGLALFDIDNCKQIELNDKLNLVSHLDDWYVLADKGSFWVSNDKCHLIKVSANGKEIVQMFDKQVLDNDFHRGSGTACMYIDKWERLWLNADGEYTAIIDMSPKFIKKVKKDFDKGLPSGTIQSITAVDKDIWVSDTYLSIIDKSSARIKKTYSANELTGKPGYFRQLFYDSLLHRIWFTAGTELFYYSLLTGKTSKTIFQVDGSPNIDYVRNFLRLNNDELLMTRLDGVYKLNNEGNEGHLIKEFGINGINHLCGLSGNRLALSVIGQPLKIYTYSPGLKLTLQQSINIENTIMMVSEDIINGTILAATEHGVYKIDNKSYRILRHYTLVDGMANDFIYAVIPDIYGWIWCSTNKGIVAINQANREIRNYGISENLQDWEFNNRAFFRDNEGYIYFGGVKGLNYFKPPYIDQDTIQPKLVIENISLNNINYSTNVNPDNIQTISYKYAAISLSIKVQALHLRKATSLKILYRVKGQQHDWEEIKNGERIQMFNLAAGKYALEISYTDGSRNKNFPIRTIYLDVIPPWYNTWWFYVVAGFSVLALIWLAVGYRQKQKLNKLKQETEIIKLKADQVLIVANERERINKDLHDDIGATLSSMHIYGDLAGNVLDTRPDESRKMIEKISSTSKELMNRMGDIVWSMKPANEEKYALEARLKNYCSELLTPKNIICSFDIDDKLSASISHPEIRKNILLIVKEAINNISKYSEASKADISLRQQNDQVLLTINDNGKGYDAGTIHQGNGLGNIELRCKQLEGKCNIQAVQEKGVTIVCSFPIAIISHIT